MKWNELQLTFGGDFDELSETAAQSALTMAEARMISEAARAAFVEQKKVPGWFDEYLKLIDLGWPWRVACYMAWAAAPKISRQPTTLDELAVMLGLRSPRVIYTWRAKYPAINQVVAMLQAAPLWEHRREVIEALVSVASTPDYKSFNDRKLFLELTGDYVPRSVQQTLVGQSSKDLTEMSDAELDAMLAGAAERQDGVTTQSVVTSEADEGDEGEKDE